jgi:hypothetical protein
MPRSTRTAHSFSGLDVETALQHAFYSARWMHRETMGIETTMQRMRVIARKYASKVRRKN